jgi:hypothetical protein
MLTTTFIIINCNYILLIEQPVKAISAVAFSPDGKYLAAGEKGLQPGILVFDTTTLKCVAILRKVRDPHHRIFNALSLSS